MDELEVGVLWEAVVGLHDAWTQDALTDVSSVEEPESTTEVKVETAYISLKQKVSPRMLTANGTTKLCGSSDKQNGRGEGRALQ